MKTSDWVWPFLFTFFASAGQAQILDGASIRFARIGVGYEIASADGVIVKPLERIEASDEPMPNHILGEKCSGERIEAISGIELSSGSNISGVFEYVGSINVLPVVRCGGDEVPVSFVLEGSADGESWFIFNNPDDSALYRYVDGFTQKLTDSFGTDTVIEEISPQGLVVFENERRFALGLAGDSYWGVIFFKNRAYAEGFAGILLREGQEALVQESSSEDSFFVAKQLTPMKPEDVYGSLRDAVADLLDLMSLRLEYDMEQIERELEQEF